jgi:hypothetical protein
MHHTSTLSLFSSGILLLGGLAAAAPVDDKPKHVKKGNGKSTCGPLVTKTVTTTITVPPTSSSSTCDGSGQTICWDGINDCGQMYGG